jgi:predicted phosphohydrolase
MSKRKIRLISDLHYDKYPDIQDLFEKLDFYYHNVDKDNEILIVAGDIGIATEQNNKGETVIREGYSKVLKYLKSRWNQIIIIAGNHEYYTAKCSVEHINTLLSNECEKYMIDFLNKDIVEIDGYIFMGCTLWSPMKRSLFEKLNPKNWSFINHNELINLHNNHKEWLERNLEKYKQKSDSNGACLRDKIIVITHYLPSQNLLHPKYTRGEYKYTTSAYVSNLESLIFDYHFLIPLWFCGHSHTPRFYRIKNTLLCNLALGNPWEADTMLFQDTFDLL